jgi:hypothetical protein
MPEVRSAVAPRVVKVIGRTGTKAAGIGADCEKGTKGRAGEVNSQTIGWRASCGCAVGDPVPATVLDPFLGAPARRRWLPIGSAGAASDRGADKS